MLTDDKHGDRQGKDPLQAPVLDLPNNGVIDDQMIEAVSDALGLPFRIPHYSDTAEGDQISLMLNGKLLRYEEMSTSDVGLLMHGRADRFNFTGRCSIYYIVSDGGPQNDSVSLPAEFIVVRSQYPNPDEGGALSPPTVDPSKYAYAQCAQNQPVEISLHYDGMAVGDVVAVKFELRAVTADKPGASSPYFYDVPDIRQTVTLQDVAANDVKLPSVPSSVFKDIDENIGRVYYIVTRVNEITQTDQIYGQSKRTVFNVDVVPPHD